MGGGGQFLKAIPQPASEHHSGFHWIGWPLIECTSEAEYIKYAVRIDGRAFFLGRATQAQIDRCKVLRMPFVFGLLFFFRVGQDVALNLTFAALLPVAPSHSPFCHCQLVLSH